MIRRRLGDRFLLITQHDHALLAGRIARYFGDGRFARPRPMEPTLRAVSLHDCGWPLHDDAPTLNKDNYPLDVFETPLSLALHVWQAAADRVVEARENEYTQLLVSLHVLGLSGFAATNPHSRRELFDINKFQQREIERQEGLRRKLGLRTDIPLRLGLAEKQANMAEEQLRHNHNVLQIADRISLALCCTEVVFPTIENIVPRQGFPAVTLSLSRTDDTTLCVEPWPFYEGRIKLSVPYRAVPTIPFASEDEFRAAYAAAPTENLDLLLRPVWE